MMCILRGMEQLATYLAQTGEPQWRFAARVNVKQSMVSRIAKGKAKPGLDLAVRIERATDGAVPVEVWVDTPEVAA